VEHAGPWNRLTCDVGCWWHDLRDLATNQHLGATRHQRHQCLGRLPLWASKAQQGCATSIPSPAIDSYGTLYVLYPCDNRIVGLDPVTGVMGWNAAVNASHNPASIAISSLNQIFVTSNTSIVCFTSENDYTVLWEAGPGDARFIGSADGRLYATAANNTIYAVSTTLGTVAWQLALAIQELCAAPVSGLNKELLIACMDGNMYTVAGTSTLGAWPQRSGRSAVVGPQGPNVIAVQAVATNGAVGSPVIANFNSVVLFGSTDGNLYKLSGTTQSVCFTAGGPILSTPAVNDNGMVYFGSDDQHVYGIQLSRDGKDCTLVWQVGMQSKVRNSPMVGVLDDVVFVQVNTSTDSSLLYALDGSTGATLWTTKAGYNQAGADMITFANATLSIPSAYGHDVLTFVDPVTGNSTHTIGTPGYAPVSSASADGYLYLSDTFNRLSQINLSTGAYIQYGQGTYVYRMAVGNNAGNITVYGTSGSSLIAIDTASGNILWSFATNATILSTPTVDYAGTVYVGSNDGNVYAVAGQTGKLMWMFETQGSVESTPAIGGDGTLYIGSNDGNLYAIQDASL
jgi:outer membrane protein assembly factor BamB